MCEPMCSVETATNRYKPCQFCGFTTNAINKCPKCIIVLYRCQGERSQCVRGAPLFSATSTGKRGPIFSSLFLSIVILLATGPHAMLKGNQIKRLLIFEIQIIARFVIRY